MLFKVVLRLLFFVPMWTPWTTGASAVRVLDRDGNLFAMRSDGTELQLTSDGIDSQPNLAPDGTKVVFVRKTGQSTSEVWFGDTEARDRVRRLVKTPLDLNGRGFDQVYTPKFSPDSTAVYFLIPYAGTTQAIIRVSLFRTELEFICAALNFEVVLGGQYRGDLVAQVRKAKLAQGYYDWYWLLTPGGKEVGVVGETAQDVRRFMELQQ